jgi:excisionase family DNA binding protein
MRMDMGSAGKVAPEDRRWISRLEAARRLGVTEHAIDAAIRSGQLATLRIGERNRVSAADVATLARSATRRSPGERTASPVGA